MKKRPSRNLVTVSTHVPEADRLSLMAIAESKKISVYTLIQRALRELIQRENKELPPPIPKQEDSSDLL